MRGCKEGENVCLSHDPNQDGGFQSDKNNRWANRKFVDYLSSTEQRSLARKVSSLGKAVAIEPMMKMASN